MTTLVTWEVEVKPSCLDEALRINKQNLPDTRAYPGCKGIELFRDQASPNKLILIEYWESFNHYERYVQWRRETGVLSNFLELCVGPAILRSFDLIDG